MKAVLQANESFIRKIDTRDTENDSNYQDSVSSISPETNKREKRESAMNAKLLVTSQLLINRTPSELQQQRLRIKKMKGQELDEFCQSSQKKVHVFFIFVFCT